VILLSGAHDSAGADLRAAKNYPSSVVVSVAGGQAMNTVSADGADHMDKFGQITCPSVPRRLAGVQRSDRHSFRGLRCSRRSGGEHCHQSGTNAFHAIFSTSFAIQYQWPATFFTHQRDQLKRNQFGAPSAAP